MSPSLKPICGQRAADLGAQLDALDGGELAEELEAAGDVALHGCADGDARRCGGRGGRGRRGQQLRPGDDAAGDQAQGDQGNAPGLEARPRGLLAAGCSGMAMSELRPTCCPRCCIDLVKLVDISIYR